MKKVFVSICIASTVLAMFSCRSVEKAIPLSSINGEWNIIEVNGCLLYTSDAADEL